MGFKKDYRAIMWFDGGEIARVVVHLFRVISRFYFLAFLRLPVRAHPIPVCHWRYESNITREGNLILLLLHSL